MLPVISATCQLLMQISLLKVLKSSAAKKAVKRHVSPQSPNIHGFFVFAFHLLITHTKPSGNFQYDMIEMLHIVKQKREGENDIWTDFSFRATETDLLWALGDHMPSVLQGMAGCGHVPHTQSNRVCRNTTFISSSYRKNLPKYIQRKGWQICSCFL